MSEPTRVLLLTGIGIVAVLVLVTVGLADYGPAVVLFHLLGLFLISRGIL